MWESVNWVQRETRPGASAVAFLFNRCDGLPFGTLLGLMLSKITVKELFLFGATSMELWNNALSPFPSLSHKSHCLKIKCSSTLAAETQIISEALAEVEWIRGLFEELTNPCFNIVKWAAKSRNRGLMVAARSSDAEMRLLKVPSIGDAKSFFDHLRTETSGGANDRRTAIDIQIIRSSMEAQGPTVRWVDHSGMYADAMTKRNGNVPLLLRLRNEPPSLQLGRMHASNVV